VAGVGGGAGPRVTEGIADDSGTDGVLLDVTDNGEGVGFVKRTGVEAVLPEMSGAGMETIDVLGVAEMRARHSESEGAWMRGDRDQMNVVSHETVAEDIEFADTGEVSKKTKIVVAVIVCEEDILAVVTPLGNVMRYTRDDDASGSCHACMLIGKQVKHKRK